MSVRMINRGFSAAVAGMAGARHRARTANRGERFMGAPASLRLGGFGQEEEALGEADDLDPFAVRPPQALDPLGQVGLESAGLRFELAVSDAHAGCLGRSACCPRPVS